MYERQLALKLVAVNKLQSQREKPLAEGHSQPPTTQECCTCFVLSWPERNCKNIVETKKARLPLGMVG